MSRSHYSYRVKRLFAFSEREPDGMANNAGNKKALLSSKEWFVVQIDGFKTIS